MEFESFNHEVKEEEEFLGTAHQSFNFYLPSPTPSPPLRRSRRLRSSAASHSSGSLQKNQKRAKSRNTRRTKARARSPSPDCSEEEKSEDQKRSKPVRRVEIDLLMADPPYSVVCCSLNQILSVAARSKCQHA